MTFIWLNQEQRLLVDNAKVEGRLVLNPAGFIYPMSVLNHILNSLEVTEDQLTILDVEEIEFIEDSLDEAEG